MNRQLHDMGFQTHDSVGHVLLQGSRLLRFPAKRKKRFWFAASGRRHAMTASVWDRAGVLISIPPALKGGRAVLGNDSRTISSQRASIHLGPMKLSLICRPNGSYFSVGTARATTNIYPGSPAALRGGPSDTKHRASFFRRDRVLGARKTASMFWFFLSFGLSPKWDNAAKRQVPTGLGFTASGHRHNWTSGTSGRWQVSGRRSTMPRLRRCFDVSQRAARQCRRIEGTMPASYHRWVRVVRGAFLPIFFGPTGQPFLYKRSTGRTGKARAEPILEKYSQAAGLSANAVLSIRGIRDT